jgi:hypothetical protein
MVRRSWRSVASVHGPLGMIVDGCLEVPVSDVRGKRVMMNLLWI